MKYVKKPVFVEAFRMTEDVFSDFDAWPEWLKLAWLKRPNTSGAMWVEHIVKKHHDLLVIMADQYYSFSKGDEMELVISPGDWIIHKGNGVLSACKNDLFVEEYEPCE